jgi:hypothetical protein
MTALFGLFQSLYPQRYPQIPTYHIQDLRKMLTPYAHLHSSIYAFLSNTPTFLINPSTIYLYLWGECDLRLLFGFFWWGHGDFGRWRGGRNPSLFIHCHFELFWSDLILLPIRRGSDQGFHVRVVESFFSY